MLLHLVDGTSETVAEDYRTIIQELEAYGGDAGRQAARDRLNKVDALDDEERRAEAKAELGSGLWRHGL